MTWTSLVDFTTGRLVSAPDWNKMMGISGNLAETAPAKVTTAEDMIVGAGANSLKRVAKGSDGQIWSVVAGVLAWASQAAPTLLTLPIVPSCRVTRAGVQSIGNGTLVAVSFDTERWDTDTIHDNATNPTRLTATRAGIYLVTLNLKWDANTTGVREIHVGLGGSTSVYASDAQTANTMGGSYYQNIATVMNLAATEWVAFYVLQSSGGNLDLVSGVNGNSVEATMTYLGRAS